MGIFIHGNGDVKKIAACKIKPYDLRERTEEENDPKDGEEKSPETVQEDNSSENNDDNEEIDAETEETDDKNEVRRDLQNDIIGAKYLQVEKSIYFMDYEIFSLEVPVKEHGKPEIIEAKNSE